MYVATNNISNTAGRRRAFSGLADDGLTILQREIACEAQKYLHVVESPVGSNCGPEVNMFNQTYFGSTQWSKWSATERCQPWCATFVWYVVIKATTRLGGRNIFPGAAQAFGNAKKSLDMSKTAGLLVDTTPAVGAAFFRTSTTPGDGSSGHMGIVVGWDGTTLSTIEGNQGQTHRVDAYSYTRQQMTDFGFQFIHVERVPITATKNTPECAPTGSGTSPSTGPTTPTTGGSTTGTSLTPPVTGNQQQSGSQEQSGSWSGMLEQEQQKTPAQKAEEVKRCKSIVFSIPSQNELQKMEILSRMPTVADDITGAHRRDLYSDLSRRNGAATKLRRSSNPEDYSQWGMFTDDHRNIFYIMREDSPIRNTFVAQKLWARSSKGPIEPYTVNFRRYFGDTWREKTAEMIQGKRGVNAPASGGGRAVGGHAVGGLPATRAFQSAVEIEGKSIVYENIPDFARQITRKYPRPFLLLLSGEPFTLKSGLIQLLDITDFITSVVAPFAKQMGFSKLMDLANEKLSIVARDTLRAIVEGYPISVGQIVTRIGVLVEAYAPKEVRQYAEKGAKVYQSIMSNDYALAAQELGINVAGATDVLAQIRNGAVASAEQLMRTTGGTFNQKRDVLQNILNSQSLHNLATRAKGNLVGELYGAGIKGNISRDKDLRQLILSGAADTLLPLLPRAPEVLGVTLREGSDLFSGDFFTDQDYPDRVNLTRFSNGVFTALGIPGDPESLELLALNSVREMANEFVLDPLYKTLNKTFSLPGGVSPASKECFATLIREEMGITVLIQGPDPDGVIRVDTTRSTQGSVITVPAIGGGINTSTIQKTSTIISQPGIVTQPSRGFEIPAKTQQIITQKIAEKTDLPVERLVENKSTGQVVKEAILPAKDSSMIKTTTILPTTSLDLTPGRTGTVSLERESQTTGGTDGSTRIPGGGSSTDITTRDKPYTPPETPYSPPPPPTPYTPPPTPYTPPPPTPYTPPPPTPYTPPPPTPQGPTPTGTPCDCCGEYDDDCCC